MSRNSSSDLDRIAAGRIAELLGEACPEKGAPGLLVALSGGPDSVALLLAARLWAETSGCALAAAHLDHGLRGDAAGADADFCRELCDHLDIAFHSELTDVRTIARRRGLGLEEAGRHARHAFFARLLAADPGLDRVATGHHLDDQAETIIMRLFRGVGLHGLRGIRPLQGEFIRPLLGMTRRQIVSFLQTQGQPWRTDTTNLTGDNVRARLRRELVPVVRDIFGPGAEQVPARLAELVDADADLLDRLAATAGDDLRRDDAAAPCLDIPGLLDLDPALARRVLRNFLAPAGVRNGRDLERVHIDSVLDWLANGNSGTSLDLPGGLQVRREFDQLLVIQSAGSSPPLRMAADYRIVVAKCTEPAGDTHLADDADGQGNPGPGPWRLTLPADALQGAVRVRNLAVGDRFEPLGLGGSKKLSDLMRERRVPEAFRRQVLVVTDDLGILWVVGLARAERTRLLPGTAKAVTILVAERQSATNSDEVD